MITTCTMNPAIDLFIRTKTFMPRVVNRTMKDDIQPNGKGVNVSFVLKMLGIDNQAIGFSGGFTGEFICKELTHRGIDNHFVRVEEPTRINVFTKVESESTEYKLVNPGPAINRQDFLELLKIVSELPEGDILCISGSNPQGVSDQDLFELVTIARKTGLKVVLDISSKVLLDLIPLGLYCIKPNDEELAVLFDKEKLTHEETIKYGKLLQEMGAEHVLISLGEKGSLYFSEDKNLYGNAPQGELVNSACAGDTLLGTFIGLLSEGRAKEECLKISIAAGSSTAFSEGLTDFSDVETLIKQIQIKNLVKEI